MLFKFTIFGVFLIVLGYALTGWLYKNKNKKLKGSKLETKILLWIPLYLGTLIFAVANTIIRLALVTWVLLNCWQELFRKNETDKLNGSFLYLLVLSLGLISSLPIVNYSKPLFMTVWFMSVLSDVVAFFAGNFFGKHSLPSALNSNKSFEGVAGQLAGAYLGFVLINAFIVSVPFYLVATVGIGSTAGDLTNSYFKRRQRIGEWSERLPGHGGYLDRFCSLSFGLLLTWVVLELTGLMI